MSHVPLSDDEKRALLRLARVSIARKLGRNVADPLIPERLLTEKRGAFVTLREGGELRGCIGYVEPVESIADSIRQLAVKAADEDPRFEPVAESEFNLLTIECSVLSPLRLCEDPAGIRVGQEGVVIEQGARRGLLLPEVAVDAGWSGEEFADHACLKAGIPPQSWKKTGTKVFVFDTEHFAESIGDPI